MTGSPPDTASEGRWVDLLTRGQIAPLIAVCMGVWLHAADGLMVATLIPDIVRDIGGATYMAWTLALYEIGSIAAGAASAVMAMRLGLRRAMVAAALVYGAGCVLSALAPDIGVMLAGRLVQGFGGGGLVALSFVAITLLFDRALMPKAIASVSALWGLSSFVGPLVGGVFAEWEFWRGGFWFFAAQAALLAAWVGWGGALNGARRGTASAARVPLGRLTLLAAGVVAIAAAGIQVDIVVTPLLLILGASLIATFFIHDTKAGDSRMLPRHAADPRTGIGSGLIALFAFATGTVAIGIYGPILMIALHGLTALEAGYVLAVSSIAWSVAAIAVASSPERRDGVMIVAGFGIVTAGIAGYAVAVAEGPIWLIALCAACEGGGFGIAYTFILRRASALVADDEQERVASALPTVQRLGYAVGAALIGIVANAAGISETMAAADAHRVASWVFAACVPVALLALLAVVRFVRMDRQARTTQPEPS